MYNGIGLQTPRGSGTNGHVQRNWAFVRPGKKDNLTYKTETDSTKLDAMLNKPPNQEILDHARKRATEVKCIEFAEILEKQGYSEDDIISKVNGYRKKLIENEEKLNEKKHVYGRDELKETHQIAEAQLEKNAKLREAFGISDTKEKSSFDKFNKKEDNPSINSRVSRRDIDQTKSQNNKQYTILRTPSRERSVELEKTKKKAKSDKKKKNKKRSRSSSSSSSSSSFLSPSSSSSSSSSSSTSPERKRSKKVKKQKKSKPSSHSEADKKKSKKFSKTKNRKRRHSSCSSDDSPERKLKKSKKISKRK